MLNDLTLTIKEAARILGKPEQTIRLGLQQGVLPFGAAILNEKQYSYIIFKKKLEDYVGNIESYLGGWNESFKCWLVQDTNYSKENFGN